MRVGLGIDVHRLEQNRNLILGGVEIPFKLGLAGHSDADVLIHAIMDSMFGALSLGDIGKFFPDTDPQFKDISSIILLQKCFDIITEKGYKIGNLDVTLCLDRPKISRYIPEMRDKLAGILNCELDQISVKATTFEGLGFIGSSDGVMAQAVVILERSN